MNPICRVKNCRYNSFHVTSRHICGKCHVYGHGIMECNDTQLIGGLKSYYNDIVTNKCSVNDCIDRETHITSGHSCRYCNKTRDHMRYCPINSNEICDKNITLHKTDEIDSIIRDMIVNKGELIILYAGMGCSQYIRSNLVTGTIEYLFMHSDMWGQYGDNTSYVPRLNAFIYKYKCVYNDVNKVDLSHLN